MPAPGYDETMRTLQEAGTAQHRKIHLRHGAREPLFGVSFAALGGLHKKIKTDQALAAQLWSSGNADARYLATMIADPDAMSPDDLEEWASGFDHYVIVELFARHLGSRSPHAMDLIDRWLDSENEWVCSCAWALMANVSLADNELPDEFFEPFVETVEAGIHGAANRVRHEMNGALIAIGTRSDALAQLATEAAERIGKVDVDHGQTGCKTPDAVPYIPKARAHRAKRKKR